MRKTQHSGLCAIYAAMMNESPEDGICTCGYAYEWKAELVPNDPDKWYKMMYSKERLKIMEDAHQERIRKSGLTEKEYDHWMRKILFDQIGAPVCANCEGEMVDTFSKDNQDGDWTCFKCEGKHDN